MVHVSGPDVRADGGDALGVGPGPPRERRVADGRPARGQRRVEGPGVEGPGRPVHAEPRERDVRPAPPGGGRGGPDRRVERVAGLVGERPRHVLTPGERPVERVEDRADLGGRPGDERPPGAREHERAPTAGVGVGARAVEEDGAGAAEGVGEHGAGRAEARGARSYPAAAGGDPPRASGRPSGRRSRRARARRR